MLKIIGETNPGRVRSMNQDVFAYQTIGDNCGFAIVCDGMGGARAGDVASKTTCDMVASFFNRDLRPDMSDGAIKAVMFSAISAANAKVYSMARENWEYSGMGTTMVAALVRGRDVTVINVGDSRIYRVNRTGIRQLTVDHSLVQMMVDRGELTPELARTYPGKNFITRAIGTEPVVESDLFHYNVDRGDCLLLCSDGLSNMMDDQEILFEVVHGTNKQLCCQRLLDIAKNRGAPDNVTSVLILI